MGIARDRIARAGRVEAVVDAPIEAVWDVLSDVTRIGEWSHECRRCAWVGDPGLVVGGRFRGWNRAGWLAWSRTSELVRVRAPEELAWRTVPTWRYRDSTEWAFSLSRSPRGTEIVQEFRVLALPVLVERAIAIAVPAHRDRRAALLADLHRLGALAGAGPVAP